MNLILTHEELLTLEEKFQEYGLELRDVCLYSGGVSSYQMDLGNGNRLSFILWNREISEMHFNVHHEINGCYRYTLSWPNTLAMYGSELIILDGLASDWPYNDYYDSPLKNLGLDKFHDFLKYFKEVLCGCR